MTETEQEIRFEQPRSTFGTWLGIVLLFVVFALFVWAVFGAMPRSGTFEEKRAQARLEKLKTTRDEATTALHGYGWLDKSKGVVRLPIERAMEVAVGELSQKKPAPANPIPPEGDKAGMQATAPVAPSPGPSAAQQEPQPTPHTAITGKDSENKGQAAAAANPPNAQPGTQPGGASTPAASPPAPASRAQPGAGAPTATPQQSAPGTPLPVPGKTP